MKIERDQARSAMYVLWHALYRSYDLCDPDSRFGDAQREAAKIMGVSFDENTDGALKRIADGAS